MARSLALGLFGLMAMAVADASMLYRFEGPRGQGWLMGTYHLGDARFGELSEAIRSRLGRAGKVRTELGLSATNLLGEIEPEALMLSGDETLATILPPELLAEFEAEVEARYPGTPFFVFLRQKIWVALLTFEMLDMLDDPEAFEGGVDEKIHRYAQSIGADIAGLETVDEQLAAFEQFSREDQIAMLRTTLEQSRQQRLEPGAFDPQEALLQAYLSQDPERMRELFAETLPEDSALLERFLDVLLRQRDERMAKRIATLAGAFPDEEIFVAVGAAHLDPETGIPALLAQMGYEVRPLTVELFAPSEVARPSGAPSEPAD
ncbi:MAG: TraB/GumN family protein [Opitutales bacterium]